MTTYLFQRMAQLGNAVGINMKNVEDARTWFRAQAARIRSVDANQMLSSDPQRFLKTKTISAANVGQMIHFFYDPKTKKKLPYYDRFPLVLPFDPNVPGKRDGERGFLGLNLHYLSPFQRARFMDTLYKVATITGKNEKRRIELSYTFLKSHSQLALFRPCIKHYLMPYVRSKFYVVSPKEWDMVLMLPTERFEQGGAKGGRVGGPIAKSKVWNESLKKANRYR